jgi:hypothetical protein
MFQVFHMYVASILSGCCMFCNGYKRVFLVFQTYVASVSIISDVCCKCFNYFGRMLQVFYLDVAKVDIGVAHVTVGPICGSHLLHCWDRLHVLGVEGAPDASTGHEVRTGHGAGAGHGAVQAPREAGTDIRTLAPSRHPGRSIIEKIKCKF